MEKNLYHEITPEGFGIAIEKDGENIFEQQSEFQKTEVFNSRAFGKVLTLDGLMMVTEKDEFFYHEMIVHIPMLTHKNPKNILIIGGGDGGTVRELLKYDSVNHIDMVEIDQVVIEASKKYFPTVSCGLEDERVSILVQDAIDFIKDKTNCYDIVLIDSTDPIGPGEGLFNEEFYNNVKKSLKKGGIVVPQTEGPFGQPEACKKTYQLLRKVFKYVAPYCSPMPTYPGGYWSWGFCSNDVKPPKVNFKPNKKISSKISQTCKLYNPNLHGSVFQVPNFVRELTK